MGGVTIRYYNMLFMMAELKGKDLATLLRQGRHKEVCAVFVFPCFSCVVH